ncbi:MAG: HAMP domain-containing sensor histidine kinase [Eubacteriales bacterium]|nr:HAMP domain-containing sensor histidine kinase [Eubacteriales bacterium]
MRILANKKIRSLFFRILLCLLVFAVISVVLLITATQNAAILIFFGSLGMGGAILIICCGYFREQHAVMEAAAEQITDYIAGNPDARIECDDEGELYRLFHEVNSLVSILNAHAENEWRAKESLKNTIADISHQLKTPLAALNIYNGILQGEAENSPTIQEFANLSEQELERIETLVQNLLKIAKLDAGAIVIEKAEEDVSEMMETIERHFAVRAAQEEKTMALSGEEGIYLSCDRNWLMEAVSNIVKNAFDHTGKGDAIRIQWARFASVVQIVIQDNGSGIHPEDLHYIFKRFYRSRFSKDTQGVGLGLPLAKAIVEAHGGTIAVDSELGAGTTFTINLLIPS